MKNVMKTALRNTKLVMILAFLPALLSAAQAQAVDYKNSYQPSGISIHPSAASGQVATPAATFHSTSAYSGQWEEQGSMTPMLNSDGTVNNEAYGVGARHPGRILRTEGGGITPPDGDDDDEKENGTPLGDVVWPLMLLLCAYVCVRSFKKKRAVAFGK